MAKGQQQQGIGAIKIWLIVFAGLWLTSTVFLVVLYTGQEELRNEAVRLRNAKARLITNDEENRIELVRNVMDGGPTAVALLEDARSQTALLAAGDPSHDVAAVRALRDQILRQVQRDGLVSDADDFQDISLHEALTMMYQAFRKENDLRRAAQQRVAELDGEVGNLLEANADQKNDFDQRAKELSDQTVEEEADRARFRQERNEAVAKLESEFDDRRQKTDAELTEQRRLRQEAQRRLAQMRERIAAQQEKFGELVMGPEELATARQPDGSVLMAVPGDDVVYIDLGKDDRLTLGLQFAVYSAETGIPVDGRAKARIEVVSISESSAECTIVNIAGHEAVLAGDLIANPVYDATRPPSFLVLGEFDLDGDGIPDPAGAMAIESMITDFGGLLNSELTALTDYVVLGAAPRRPRKLGSDPAPEQVKRARVRQQLLDNYTNTRNAATSLSVPVMTQEVFLSFLGYSGRYARR